MIHELIENYKEQEKIYQQVAISSLQQTALLENQAVDTVMIREVLQDRQLLMDNVTAINEAAKNLQDQLKQHYGLKTFNLSEIEGKVSHHDFFALKEVLDKMAEVLKGISQNDLKNQGLMRQAAVEAHSQPTISNQQASSAYRQAMQPKKP